MRKKLIAHAAFSAAVCLAAIVVIGSTAGATSVVSSIRTISVQSTSAPVQTTSLSKTIPGAFVDSVSTGTTDSSSSAQDSVLTETAALLRVSGNGTTEAARTTSGGTAVTHVGESFFETNFALAFDTPY